MTMGELINKLQTYSHEGYAIHSIELISKCENCSSDVILDDPKLKMIVAEDNNIKLIFKNKD